jgi:hypothetical protein
MYELINTMPMALSEEFYDMMLKGESMVIIQPQIVKKKTVLHSQESELDSESVYTMCDLLQKFVVKEMKIGIEKRKEKEIEKRELVISKEERIKVELTKNMKDAVKIAKYIKKTILISPLKDTARSDIDKMERIMDNVMKKIESGKRKRERKREFNG